MMESLPQAPENGRKRSGPDAVLTHRLALTQTHLSKETRMADYGQYTDSESDFKTQWKSIGELARKIIEGHSS